MKMIAWNTTPRCSDSAGGDPCPSATWFWLALVAVVAAGFLRGKGRQ